MGLVSAGWLIHQKLPASETSAGTGKTGETTIRLVLRPGPELSGLAINIPVELYPVDVVAVQHEYFIERRAGERYDDFLNERMNGRTPVTARLDPQGQAMVVVRPGNWWVHAVLAGEEDIEWRLPIRVSGPGQTVELTPQNAYARTKTF